MNVEGVLEILNLVGKRKGDEVWMPCPFHDDSHPSFSVNAETGQYNCFVCGGGGLVGLVAKVQNISFSKAKKWLAEAEVAVAGLGQGNEDFLRAIADKPETSTRLVAPLYTRRIKNWVIQRGFTPETLRRYYCGYSMALDSLVIPMLGANALCYRRNPAFTVGPKYKYTEGFKAHSYLYGWHDLDTSAGHIILVEGPLDLLWLRQHGYQNALAILGGGKLGRVQTAMLKDKLLPVVLAFDNDGAGKLANEKVVTQLKGLEVQTVNWANLQYESDPDDSELTTIPGDVADLSEDFLKALFQKTVAVGNEQ